MSYILNALRKSEAQRRLGQTPDLHDVPAIAPSLSRRGKKRRGLVLVLVPLAALTVAVGWLLAEPVQQWLTGGRAADVSGAPVAVEQTAQAEQPAATPPESLATAETEQAETDPATVDRRSPRPDTSLVGARPAPERAVDVPRPASERERLVETPEEAQRLIEQARLSEGTRPAATPGPIDQGARPEAEPALPRDLPAAAQAEADAGPWVPERSEFVRQWELPLAIRRDLPELNLSIHVFSPEPSARFVLINGERRVEGDDLGQGARLVEIRRDGALVEFRDYRFLLEP